MTFLSSFILAYCPRSETQDNCTVPRFITKVNVNLDKIQLDIICLSSLASPQRLRWCGSLCLALRAAALPGGGNTWGNLEVETLGGIQKWFFLSMYLLWCFGSWFCSWPVPWLQSRAGSADLLVVVGARPQLDDLECPLCSFMRTESTRYSIYCMPIFFLKEVFPNSYLFTGNRN